MRKLLCLAVLGALCITCLARSPAVAAEPAVTAAPDVVSADLDGKPIRTRDIPNHYCHDHDFPRIRCYSSSALLEAATASAATAAVDYVIAYSGQSYSGSYVYISSNYDALAVIGWNDRTPGRSRGPGTTPRAG